VREVHHPVEEPLRGPHRCELHERPRRQFRVAIHREAGPQRGAVFLADKPDGGDIGAPGQRAKRRDVDVGGTSGHGARGGVDAAQFARVPASTIRISAMGQGNV
jgi:hypothetical protein